MHMYICDLIVPNMVLVRHQLICCSSCNSGSSYNVNDAACAMLIHSEKCLRGLCNDSMQCWNAKVIRLANFTKCII